MINAQEEFLHLESELHAEEGQGPITDLSELAQRKKKREALDCRLTALEREVRILRQRWQRLPELPDLASISWAQSVLAFPNGRILIVDTAFASEEACIVHLLLLDFQGNVCFEQHTAPGCLLPEGVMRDLGITARDLQMASPLSQAWPSPLDVLSFEADDWGRLSHIKELASRFLEECARLTQATGRIVDGSEEAAADEGASKDGQYDAR